MKKSFHGWWIVFASVITFGLSTGLPYYNISFFYDYFQREYNWTREDITLGFPLAALLAIWVGPIFIARFSPRKTHHRGTGLTFWPGRIRQDVGRAVGSTTALGALYDRLLLLGPPPHQIIVSHGSGAIAAKRWASSMSVWA